jgi:hypothetical protein
MCCGRSVTLAVQLQQVAALQCFETEVVVAEITVIDDGAVERLGVFLDQLVHIVGEQGRAFAGLRVDVVVEVLHGLAEGLLGVLVQVAHGDAAGELRIVGVAHRHGGGDLGGEVVQHGGGNAVVDAVDHFQGDLCGVHDGVQPVAELLHPCGDLVEFHCLPASVAFDYVHASWCCLPPFSSRWFDGLLMSYELTSYALYQLRVVQLRVRFLAVLRSLSLWMLPKWSTRCSSTVSMWDRASGQPTRNP